MARIKRKFNTKLLKRFNKKELVSFMRKYKIPAEKALGRYTKAEIVSQLIRLQRNKLYYSAFDNLKIKPPRTLSEAQKKNLASHRLNKKSLKTKQSFPQQQKIDVGRPVENAISVEAGVVNSNEVDLIEASKMVNQQPTALEQIKVGDNGTLEELEAPLERQFSSLEELFVFSDKKFSSQKKRVIDLIIQRKQEKGIQVGTSGKQPTAIEVGSSGTQGEIEPSAAVAPSSFSVKVSKLTVPQIKAILDEAQISRRGLTLKAPLVQKVVINKNLTEELVNKTFELNKNSQEIQDQFNRIRLEPTQVQEGQVVEDNEGAKSQTSKRNVLPQGDRQSVQDVINKKVGNIDKVKKKNGNGGRKIVVNK